MPSHATETDASLIFLRVCGNWSPPVINDLSKMERVAPALAPFVERPFGAGRLAMASFPT